MINLIHFFLFPNVFLTTFDTLKRKISAGYVFIIIVLIAFSKILMKFLFTGTEQNFLNALIFWWFGLIIFMYVSVFLLGSLIAFYADMSTNLQQSNSRTNFYFFFLLSYSPILLLPGITIMYKFFIPTLSGFTLIQIGIMIWTFILQIKIIKYFFHFSAVQSVFAYSFSFIFLFVFYVTYFYNLIFSLAI